MITRRHVVALTAAVSAAAVAEAAAGPLSRTVAGDSHGAGVRLREIAVDEATMSIGEPRSLGGAGRRTVLSPPLRGGSFAMVGLRWPGARDRGGPPLTMSVRTGSGGRWEPWRQLHRDTDAPDLAGPDGNRPDTVCAAPVWAGPSDAIQVRVELPGGQMMPAGLRAVLIDPGFRAADAHPAAPAPTPVPGPAATSVLLAPVVRSRSQWGANPRLQRAVPRYTTALQAGFVHHTAGTNTYEPADVPAILRGIQAYHVRIRGWSDVGYNLLVDKFGRVWEGRAGGVDKRVLGAHTGGFNAGTFGVAALGDFQSAQPTPELLASLARVVAWKFLLDRGPGFDPLGTVRLRSDGGGVSRYPAGTSADFARISGHRDAGVTSCPGRNLYARLPALRTVVAAALTQAQAAAPARSAP